MQRHVVNSGLALLTIVLGLSTSARAQFGGAATGGPSVTGTGVNVVKRSPETLRLRIDLSGSAKNVKDALAKLKTASDAATSKLAELDAEKDSIKIAAPRIAEAANDQRRQMEMMVRQRMRATGKKPKATPEPPVVVSAALTAEWKLAGKDPVQLLIDTKELEEKVKAADLAGLKQKSEEASEEDQELAEEMMDQFGNMGGDESQPKPGDPLFMYVAKIGGEERTKALSDAFTTARAEAEQLAAAATAKLGSLRGLQSNAASNESQNYNYGRYNMQQYMFAQMAATGETAGGTPTEAVGVQPGEVSLTFTVVASFELLPGGK